MVDDTRNSGQEGKDVRFQIETCKEYAAEHRKLLDCFIDTVKDQKGNLVLTNYQINMLI
jgi:hypothetical protein